MRLGDLGHTCVVGLAWGDEGKGKVVDVLVEHFGAVARFCAHLVFPYHRKQDVLSEQAALPGNKIGTTARGIGPCYADKVSRRWGVRVCELYSPDRFRARIRQIVAHKNAYLKALYDIRDPLDPDGITEEYLKFAAQLRPFVGDTVGELHRLMRSGKRVLFEGAQGSLLDVDHGTYPFVTSSSAGVGGVASGAGVPPGSVRSVVGVLKAYTTRVGAGPFPTELNDEVGETIRHIGKEFGTTTGRPRRCGWFDAVAAGYAAQFSGPTHLAIMHLDTLASFDEIKVCVAYKHGTKTLNTFPADTYVLQEAEPVYETLPGWKQEIGHCRRWDDLPREAQQYLQCLSRRLETPIGIVGVGPEREQVIFVD
ncbi:MAG: adenylosuccinate synthase [Planctomycetes bacterium]|nr:adenylosuccinate synthase [Planctomycetota bacterium]